MIYKCGLQIEGRKANLTYKRRDLVAHSAVSLDNMVSGEPHHTVIEPQKKA